MENKTLASVVKNARERIGISQREVSRRTGIDNNTLAKIEKGERKKPNVLSLRKISFLLNLDLEELLKLAGYNDQDIEVALNQRNFIISSGNAPLISLEDMINRDKDELLSRKILKELGTKIDYNEIDFINKMNSKDRNKSIKIFKKFLKDNDKEIKKLSDQIEEELKILIEKTN
ncbi:MAG: helix-turn-helix transcriptional regulator [Bacilli bacterium]|nr:helix-turn-helix transcriptional regulator [Bacilli bacterium]